MVIWNTFLNSSGNKGMSMDFKLFGTLSVESPTYLPYW
jgi:hypothetical protein